MGCNCGERAKQARLARKARLEARALEKQRQREQAQQQAKPKPAT